MSALPPAGQVRPVAPLPAEPGRPGGRQIPLSLPQALALAAFQVLITLLLPLFLLRLWWRGRRQPGYREHWRERLGWYDTPGRQTGPPPIWIHAVSVGETRACVPLVAALRAQQPGCRILLTHMTPTGRATGRELFGSNVEQCYLPYDTPGAVARFLKHFRPALGLLMETELWPTLIRQAAAGGTPLWLVNARLSARSARGYSRVDVLVRPALAGLTGVLAQSEADAGRLQALGAQPVQVTGNLKFDAPLPADETAQAQELRRALGAQRAVWLAASTREGEEALLLDALVSSLRPAPAAAQWSEALLVLVPRHPQRFEEVAALLAERGLPYVRRSAWPVQVDASVRVVLGDSMGELGLWYAAVDLAWIGGSLLPLGGQNLLEACARGCPALLGPHVFNFAAASAEALSCGAAQQVDDAQQLIARVQALLANPAVRAAMAAAGKTFVARHRGASARTVAALGVGLGLVLPESHDSPELP